MSGGGKTPVLRWGRRQPDPVHGWVAVVPRRWPWPEGFWIDLDGRRLQGAAVAAGLTLAPPGALDDTVYLPPVSAERRGERDALARRCLEGGAPVLMQLSPGEEARTGAAARFDLTPALLGIAAPRRMPRGEPAAGVPPATRPGRGGGSVAQQELPLPRPAPRSLQLGRLPLAELPAGAAVLWPLIAGLTDDAALRDEALGRLAGAGVAAVHGVAVEVAPADRRTLADLGGDTLYDRLFHAPPPSERAFAAAVARQGMEPFTARPAVAAGRGGRNRELSAALALLGELWLRLGRSEGRGQAFYAAARWIDGEERDLAAIHRDGNLAVVTWLDAESRAVVEELLATGSSTLLAEVRSEYVDTEEVEE